MRFKTYVSKLRPDQRKGVAKKIGISVSYFNQIAREERKPSAKLAIKIESVTGVTRKSLLPKIF